MDNQFIKSANMPITLPPRKYFNITISISNQKAILINRPKFLNKNWLRFWLIFSNLLNFFKLFSCYNIEWIIYTTLCIWLFCKWVQDCWSSLTHYFYVWVALVNRIFHLLYMSFINLVIVNPSFYMLAIYHESYCSWSWRVKDKCLIFNLACIFGHVSDTQFDVVQWCWDMYLPTCAIT